jgi:hypothetical protein
LRLLLLLFTSFVHTLAREIPSRKRGVPFPYTAVAGADDLRAFFHAQGIRLFPPQQYLDKFHLTPQGVTSVANDEIKAKLGLNTTHRGSSEAG